jgi:diguanylate cyclase (GGDEF)-like protein/PAS domain S-box-containing protein
VSADEVAPAYVVLVVGDDAGDEVPGYVADAALRVGLDVRRAAEKAGVADLLGWLASEAPPRAVLLSESVSSPLVIARHLRQAAPLMQMVFLIGPERSESLRHQMTLAPMIGNHWTIVAPDGFALPRALEAAVRATRQRSNLRTTLDRMNLRMQDRRAAAGDEDFRRLIISDRYLASILEHAGDAILTVDGHDRITTWNRGASTLFGHEEAEALEQRVDLLVSDDATSQLLTLVHTARAGKAAHRHELTCERADGSRFDADVTVAPVRSASGDVASISLIARDITKRKRAESHLKEANASLERALDLLEAKKQELLDLNAQLEVQATTDALTGLKNRVVFHNRLLEMLAVAARQCSPLSLLLIDIDHFKRINDTHGHLEGDRVLVAIAACLLGHTREQDVVTRYGGEEFAILLPNTSTCDAMVVAEKLRVGCRDTVDVEPGLTISIGAASSRAGDSDVTLIGRADAALYASKRAGRDRVTSAGDVD